jgi:hypothetical protein
MRRVAALAVGAWLLITVMATETARAQAPAAQPPTALDPLRSLWQPGKGAHLRNWLVHAGDPAGFDPAKPPSGPLWQPYAAWSDPGDIGPMADGAGSHDATMSRSRPRWRRASRSF